MPAPEPSPRRVRFGPFTFDPAARELEKGGVRVAVPEQALRLLVLLLENPGALVTRDELRQRLWPSETAASFDQSLNSAVRRLRELLGDAADSPLFIETVPRHGYRFIATVAPEPASAPTVEPAAALPAREKAPLGWIGAGAVALAAAIVILAAVRRDEDKAAAPARVVPLTSFSGREFHPALSPDGTRVAFLWDGDAGGRLDLYEKVIGTETLLRLTRGGTDICCPSWSADGRSIAFLKLAAQRPEDQPGALCIVPALGGTERCLAGVRTWFGSNTSWSPDGSTILVSASEDGVAPPTVTALSADGREVRRLTRPEAGVVGDAFPTFSPDGAWIAFARVFAGGDALTAAQVMVLPAAGGTAQPALQPRWIVAGLDWTPDSQAIVFAGGPSEHRLWRLPRGGGTPEPLLDKADAVLANAVAESVNVVSRGARVSVARSGRRLAFSRGSHDTDMWRLALAADGRAAAPPERWLASTRLEEAPHFAPDGRRVAFASTRASETPEIWLQDGETGPAVQLTSLGVHSGTPRFSPDGRSVVFDSRTRGNADVHLLDVETRRVRPLAASPGEDVIPSWSADGRTVYFASDRDGAWRLYAVAADGSGAERALGIEGFAAAAAPDGPIYYTKFGKTGLWRRADGGPETAVLDDLHCWGYWALSARGVYYLAGPADREIRFRPHGDGPARKVADLPGLAACGEAGLALSPDGRTLLVVAVSQGSDLMLADGVP
jgi:Tol biopolymer transport system component/DNA-binding winged helix-turn-helix (wHTH) protein